MANHEIRYTDDAWDDGTLGRDEQFVVVADTSHESALDEALGLQSISIRLPKQLIQQYKLIAQYHRVGYQPLMRDVMARFVPAALREIMDAEQKKAIDAVKSEPLIPEPNQHNVRAEVAARNRQKKAA